MAKHNQTIKLNAPAKINLFLNINGIREDGYHTLSMVNAKVGFCDQVTCHHLDTPEIELTCSDSSVPTDSSNTAYQAAERFFKQTEIRCGLKIHIDKRIPKGAGLGGGSSDAAAVLKALMEFHHSPLTIEALNQIATEIGADVPFFLYDGICVCTGIGERVSSIEMKTPPQQIPLYVVICSPDVEVSTPKAYKLWDQLESPKQETSDKLVHEMMNGEWSMISSMIFNSFEQAIYQAYPELKKAINLFREISPTPPMLSGSGSNMFSLHTSLQEAEGVSDQLSKVGYQSVACDLLT